MKHKNSIIAALAAFTIAGPASAAVVATAATGANGFFAVSSTDLADASQSGTVSFSGSAVFGSAAAKVIDGGVYNPGTPQMTLESLTPSVGSTLILNLATSSLYGWNLNSIVVLTGVGDLQPGRSDHGYTIALSTDGTTFGTPFINVNDATVSASTGGEVRMTIADDASAPLGTGIKAVRFVFANVVGAETESMFREIDVLGVASVPEPSAALLGGLGMLALLRRRRA